MTFVLGVDVGGTFTDAVAVGEDGAIASAKVPTTPNDLAAGVIGAVSGLAHELTMPLDNLLAATTYVAHGTTTTLNSLVTGDVARAGFITTRGHRDSIYIMNGEGRYLGRAPHEIQDILHTRKPPPLVPKEFAREVTERIDYQGRVVIPLDEQEVRQQLDELLAREIEALAVSLLWSFRNPTHEQRIRDIAAEVAPDLIISLSSDLSPRIREFARNATTIMSTQVAPTLRRYLQPLERELRDRGLSGPLFIMQSSGGTIRAEEAPESAITTVGSVLTGGLTGSVQLARRLGHRNVISTDVGGTTFLVGLVVDGAPLTSSTTILNQHLLNVPTLRVEAIGSGGGAIAAVDAGGNLRVGPRSAGAMPGPACYGEGGAEPTVTDANLVLGILDQDYFLGGTKRLSRDLAEKAIRSALADPLGLSVHEAAAAVFEVQNAQTADFVRKVVVEAGHDPREFVVYAFGGAGPAHCFAYAGELGVEEIVVPLGQTAAAFSAFGLAGANVSVSCETSDPSDFPLDSQRVSETFARLERRARDALEKQRVEFAAIELRREVDVRYSLQLAELSTPLSAGAIDDDALSVLLETFESLYARRYGPSAGFREAGYQAITFRVHGVGELGFKPEVPKIESRDRVNPDEALKGTRPVMLDFQRGFVDTAVYDYRLLGAGDTLDGPAIVEVPTTTVVVPAGQQAHIDSFGNLVMSAAGGERAT